MPLHRDAVLKRLAEASVDMWSIARESNPEQVEAIQAVQDGRARPCVMLQLGTVLQVSVGVLHEPGDGDIEQLLYIDVPPISMEN